MLSFGEHVARIVEMEEFFELQLTTQKSISGLFETLKIQVVDF
jgi:hypothetical protein